MPFSASPMSTDQFTEAFDTAERQFPDAVSRALCTTEGASSDASSRRFSKVHFVVIEEGVILAPDFLAYLAQLLPLLDLDSTISSISAWNDNGRIGQRTLHLILYAAEEI